MEKMLWYSVSRACAVAQFLVDHASRPEKSSCWKSASFLCSTVILTLWIPCISSSFPNIPGETLWWYGICSYDLSDLDSFSDGDWSHSQIPYHDCYLLALCSHLGIGIHDPQPVRQVWTISLLQNLHLSLPYCCPGTWSWFGHVWSLKKNINFLLLSCLDSLIQVSQNQWCNLQLFCIQWRAPLGDKPKSEIFWTHLVKWTTHLSHSP